ncbi:MAG TPA: type II toxin-antitoxin system RelE/ParE family toxin [Dongiaceae bacterium]
MCSRLFVNFPRTRDDGRRQIRRVQQGQEPVDWKPVPAIGPNVKEIRIRESGGAFRVIYQATMADVVVVIGAFRKKTQKTPQHEIQKARARLGAFLRRGSKP